MKLKREELLNKLKTSELQEFTESGVEFKQSWNQKCGKDISAIANKLDRSGGWIVVGVNDDGVATGMDRTKAKEVEELVSNHVGQYLSPDFSVVNIKAEKVGSNFVILVEVVSPNEVVRWNNKSYKLIGTTSSEMNSEEILSLTLSLPGADFSKLPYLGEIDESLVVDFAQKVAKAKKLEDDFEVKNLNSEQILSKIQILNKNASGILFGLFNVRIVFYDENDDILEQKIKKGLYSILKDSFIDEIITWTRTNAVKLEKNSIVAIEEQPYPLKALREALANAVAHSKYNKDRGGILIELYPSRLTISNHCDLDAKFFVDKWFSKVHKTTNGLLMESLRLAGISDELGSGKRKVFREMIEKGKREPIIEFCSYGQYATWSLTLYNENSNLNTLNLLERLKEFYSDIEKRRLIVAFVLWQSQGWSKILDNLDQHYKNLAEEIKNDKHSPFLVVNEKIYLKRWVKIALDGSITKKFTETEERELKDLLSYIAFLGNRNGFMTFEEIRSFVGMQNSQSETVQLSKLLAKWKNDFFVEKVPKKRGEWKFLIRSKDILNE